MKVFVYQPHKNFGLFGNRKIIEDFVKNNDANLFVFPELYISGYFLRDEIYNVSLSRDDEFFDPLIKIAKEKKTNIIFGFPEKENGFLYNSAMIIDENGNKKVYRKMHLPNFGPFEEYLYFKPGNELVYFDTSFGRVGVEICYDIFFPFITEHLAMNGVNYIVNISASPVTSRSLFELLIPTRAVENTVFFIYNNWAGTQRNLVFWGGSTIVSPRGKIIKKAGYIKEEIIKEELNTEEIKVARAFRPVLRDNRNRQL
ncbi:MAG: carbon-nitrogen hydrolase family protein [Thermoplasmata archaeon]|jgi:predicted amidohydrolase